MQSTLAYEFKGLTQQVPVTAFCLSAQTCYAVQTIKQDTVITKCQLEDSNAVATTDQITLQKFVNVHSLSLISQAPQLSLLVCGQPVDDSGQAGAPELWFITINSDKPDQTSQIFKVTHLESANITGTPLPEPVIGAVSALSSDHSELTVMVLDKAQHLQCSVYNVKQITKLLWQLTESGETTIEAGSLKFLAAVYQSFKPTEKQLDPQTIGSIQSIAFSNGRAIYATKSYGEQHAVSKGFWLLKNGFHDQPVTDLPADTELTGIALLGKYVYFGMTQKNNDHMLNTVHRVEKALWS
ncbi:hypothetical protein HC026_02240 [Lactobacillus sp. LC28-10]|uniref:Uncharacterized protein n=1 Tax=Secundilactobacillus angelensis TaxID=2722706 RepID=A0ABX1KWN7_9LACO|nr:helveticin J family class III bacteriocin [Secundilactobacillus angelensis]MCH5461452.1 hypothetical protein [Secundilactobacillus angelensis]NLR17735.1 hypothetical protein [Secundilactobacillus angelensis]